MTLPLSMSDVAVGYRRKRPVLQDVTLAARPGSITGLLGRNGAGKTTLIHTALGLRKAWHGQVELFGRNAWDAPAEIRKRVGFVPQRLDDFHWLTVSQCLDLIGGFHDRWDAWLVGHLREQWAVPDERIGSLSPGMRQRVAVLLAIGHRPDLLVLDEPLASLDPSARRGVLRLIGEMNAQTGQTVLLSSHQCSDIERICSDVAILHAGRIVLHTAIDDLKEQVRRVSGMSTVPSGDDVLAARADRLWLRNWRAHDLSSAARVDGLSLEEFFLDITA